MENGSVFARIVQLLESAGATFRTVEHEPTQTSADSARVRGVPLGCGAKALLLKCDGTFRLFVLPADRKLQSKSLRTALGVKDVRFATPEELHALTGLVPGSVPPFGEPILPFPLFADVTVGREHAEVAFNAGALTRSIIMPATAWAEVARPQRLEFAATE
jgi:prolyl-tRNA editing enzyme YbaK/EbsC (Cys-tRNA(Pro) deacylase)